jgi:hypothetical protein
VNHFVPNAKGWRLRARQQISQVVEDHPRLHHNRKRLFEFVSKSYPFGMREYTPYKIWLEEVNFAKDQLAARYPDFYSHPLDRYCKSCGGSVGRPCKRIHDDDPILVPTPKRKGEYEARLEVANDADMADRKDVAAQMFLELFHAYRVAIVGRIAIDNGPLFAAVNDTRIDNGPLFAAVNDTRIGGTP